MLAGRSLASSVAPWRLSTRAKHHSRRRATLSTARLKSSLSASGTEEEEKSKAQWFRTPSVANLVSSSAKLLPSLKTGEGEEKEKKETLVQLSPKVPLGARHVQVRGTNRRSNLIQFFRARSIDVNFDYRSWAKHSGPWRNVEVWSPRLLWKVSDMRRIMFPDVTQVAVVAGGITYYNSLCAAAIWKVLDTDGDGDVSVSELKAGIDAGIVEAHHIMGTDFFITNDMVMLGTTVPFTLTSLALGMMLAFRTQNCNARYNEARAVWGGMVNEGRSLSSRILSLVGDHPKDSEVSRAAVHAVKCIMTFSHALKFHVTTDGYCPDLKIRLDMTDAEVNEAKGGALRQELMAIWDCDDATERGYVDRLLAPGVANRPMHALQEITEITARVFAKSEAEGGAGLPPHHIDAIYRSIARFQDVLGACERLYKTPIYTGATRFTSRCVWLWTNLIPFALYPMMGPVATLPTSVVVAMFMYGLEDVGARMEQPFGSLPLWQYCDGIDAGCRQTLAQHQVLKQVTR